MDSIDHKILRELKQNARLSNHSLSERVGLSPTPCLRRVRALERAGIIKGYGARIDPDALGLSVMAFVQVRLERQTKSTISKFEAGIKKLDEVVACYLMSGSHDYLLQVLSTSLDEYESIIRDKLTEIEGIGSLETHFVFGRVKQDVGFSIP